MMTLVRFLQVRPPKFGTSSELVPLPSEGSLSTGIKTSPQGDSSQSEIRL